MFKIFFLASVLIPQFANASTCYLRIERFEDWDCGQGGRCPTPYQITELRVYRDNGELIYVARENDGLCNDTQVCDGTLQGWVMHVARKTKKECGRLI